MSRYPRVLPAGDAALTVEFGATIDPEINDRVMAFARAVSALSLPAVVEVVPTYRSATVYVDPTQTDFSALVKRLEALTQSLPLSSPHRSRAIDVPVLYGGEYGPDLREVAGFARLSIEDVIALHISVEYRVYMLGFSPGFPYMGRVPDRMAMPRLATPRKTVPAGSVGIAGLQTGIYPLTSPGGWRLIGRTPLRLYDPERRHPFLAAPGDRVRFVAIDQRKYDALSKAKVKSVK